MKITYLHKNKNKMSDKKLKVYLSRDVREQVKQILDMNEEELGVKFCLDPKGCDTELMLDADVLKFEQAVDAKRVPIVPCNDILEDFDPVAEKGGAFTFDPKNKWTLIDALVRARENRRFPYDWKNILKFAKQSLAK